MKMLSRFTESCERIRKSILENKEGRGWEGTTLYLEEDEEELDETTEDEDEW